jgi:hypothetical protein
MDIYKSSDIYGIKIYNIENRKINTLYEKKYYSAMSHEEIKKVYSFYDKLTDKKNIFFQIYIDCHTKYEYNTFMLWTPISSNTFLQKFNI